MFAIFIGFITKITLYFEFEVSQSINLMTNPSFADQACGRMSWNNGTECSRPVSNGCQLLLQFVMEDRLQKSDNRLDSFLVSASNELKNHPCPAK
jgi:hypothetical protein